MQRVEICTPKYLDEQTCIFSNTVNFNWNDTHIVVIWSANDILLHENARAKQSISFYVGCEHNGTFQCIRLQKCTKQKEEQEKEREMQKAPPSTTMTTIDNVCWTMRLTLANRSTKNKTTSSIANGYFIWIPSADCLCTTETFYLTFVLLIWLPLYYHHHKLVFCWRAHCSLGL